jgi:cholinesterase
MLSTPRPKQTIGKNWYELSKTLRCGGVDAGASTIACVQTKPMKAVQDAMPLMPTGSVPGGISGLRGGFGPVVDNHTVFGDVAARAKSGNFIKKPMLIGANQNEGNGMICSSADAAKARKLHNVPVWRYHFANNKPGSTKGANHGEDVPQVFGDGVTGISKLFQDGWAAFTKDPVKVYPN